jgi:glycerophosphoryl diester phosphodiesterase
MLKIGHRGTAGLRPENTRVGFEKAIELGLDMVELDIQLTKDNQIVVIHDSDLVRIAGKNIKIEDLTLAQLKQVDIGSHFAPAFSQQRIMTLKELIDLVKGKMMLNIELKMSTTKSELLIAKLVDLLAEERFSDEVIISSFKHSYLQEIGSKFKTAILINSCPVDPVAMIESANADGVHPNYKFLTPDLINRVQSRGYFVNTWTVNKQSEIKKLEEFGVDGIITDEPQLFF